MTTPAGDWINLSEAALILGVHPATVRNWSDKGRLPVYRTSGGHRRYKRSEVELWAQSARQESKASPQNSMQIALRQIRVRIAEGQLEAEGWYQKLERLPSPVPAERARPLRQLAIASGEPALAEAQALGYEYAARARSQDLSRVEAVQAFLFFKNALVEGIMQVFADARVPSGEAWALLSQVTAFTDEILVSLLGSYRALNEH
jgi:excisionase family DNA binding protein